MAFSRLFADVQATGEGPGEPLREYTEAGDGLVRNVWK
jgi:hypothetical protein